jgi:hypothetical protein
MPHERIDYPEMLRLPGQFIQQQHLNEVAILEFDRGWIVSGVTYQNTAQGFIRVAADFVLSHEELRHIIQQMRDQRKPEPPHKGRWLG